MLGAVLLQCAGCMTPPKDVHVLIPRGCDPVTLLGDVDFTDMPEILRWGVVLGGQGDPIVSQRSLEEEGGRERDGDWKMQ